MTVPDLAVTLIGVFALLMVAEPVAAATRLPYSTVQLLFGAGLATILVVSGIDSGLRHHNFHDLVLYILLPLLIYHGATAVTAENAGGNLLADVALAVVGVLGTVIVAASVYLGIDHPGFPWLGALITAALLAATDPTATLALLKEDGRVRALLSGESAFNNAIAIVLFSLLVSAALHTDGSVLPWQRVGGLVGRLAGGLGIGLAAGLVVWLIHRTTSDESARHWMGLAAALGSYYAAESVAASGAVACLTAGLIAGRQTAETSPFWGTIGRTASGVLFLLTGATMQLAMFQHRWLAMLMAIAAVMVARQLTAYAALMLATVARAGPFDARERTTVALLGTRGAVTLALVLMLPKQLPYWWTIQSIAYGVVLFDLCIVAPVAPLIAPSLDRQNPR